MKPAHSLIVCFLFFTIISLNQDDELAESISRGKIVYSGNCISCHQADGTGVAGIFPPLAKSDFLIKSTQEAIKTVKYGLQGAITVNDEEYDNMMPEPGLKDQEVADVMNYILNSFGNSNGKMITLKQVEAIKREE